MKVVYKVETKHYFIFSIEIEFLMSVGCKIFGDRMSSLKMPSKLHFTKWVSLITICGFITTKRLSTWPSKWGSRNFFVFFWTWFPPSPVLRAQDETVSFKGIFLFLFKNIINWKFIINLSWLHVCKVDACFIVCYEIWILSAWHTNLFYANRKP